MDKISEQESSVVQSLSILVLGRRINAIVAALSSSICFFTAFTFRGVLFERNSAVRQLEANMEALKQTLISFGGALAYKSAAPVENAKTYDYLFKILLIGDCGVGKSCMLLRFTEDTFFDNSFITTIGVDFKIKTIQVGNTVIKLQVWDTSGQERFRTITSSYYRGAHGVMIVYDVSNLESFNSVQKWLQETERYCSENVNRLIVGAKSDLPKAVSTSQLQDFAGQLNLPFIETSSKTGQNVFEAFSNLAINIAQKLEVDVDVGSEVKAGQEKEIKKASSDSDDESFSEEDLTKGMMDGLKKGTEEKNEEKDAEPKEKKQKANKVKASKANVNVFRLDLSTLDNDAPVLTGDPVRCNACGAMLNIHSEVKEVSNEEFEQFLKEKENLAPLELAPPIHIKFENCVASNPGVGKSGSLWKCEFCAHTNLVDLDSEEIDQIKQGATLDFLVQQPDVVSTSDNSRLVCFCIDVSGSMCVTTEVEGNFRLMGADKRQQASRDLAAAQGGNYYNQWLPNQRRDVTHVSRLQCVQAAVANQIELLCASAPETRVALITFSNEVHILGDGSQDEVVITGDKLNSWEDLMQIGTTYRVQNCVKEAKKRILAKLWALEEGGQTALGPALQVSMGIASNAQGSSVVLCTDGLANMGVGQLEDTADEVNAKLFYTELGERARLHGLTVNVISLIGAECRLEALTAVTEQSRGSVERVAATQLQNELSAIVDKPVVATGTMAMVCLSRLLHFKGEMDDELEKRNWLVKDLGTVHKGDECTFSYGFRGIDTDDEMVPFQVQILHKRLDGTEVLRVATAQIKLTSNREEAEKHADATVVATHAAQRAAAKAKAGDFRAAQLEMRSAQRFMKRAKMAEEQVHAWTSNVEQMDKVLRGDDGEGNVNAEGLSDNAARNISKFSQINKDSLF